ncbi:hypothetical protein ABAC402_00705 [Asticcacaulis sp. AC402]|nr:hypothetical protein ABAC402_00705 [Asticcacaulis sp. AC402]
MVTEEIIFSALSAYPILGMRARKRNGYVHQAISRQPVGDISKILSRLTFLRIMTILRRPIPAQGVDTQGMGLWQSTKPV